MIIAVVFFLLLTNGMIIKINSALDISFTEVILILPTTLDTSKKSLKNNAVLGTYSCNTFLYDQSSKPMAVNSTVFWNALF